MRTRILLSGAAVLGLATALPASAHPDHGHVESQSANTDRSEPVTKEMFESRALERFDRADRDGDGIISPEEMRTGRVDGEVAYRPGAEARHRYGQRFRKMDVDGDGVVSQEEARLAALGRHAKKSGEDGSSETSPTGEATAVEAERRALARFAEIDTNSDGLITRAEMKEAHKRHRTEKAEARAADPMTRETMLERARARFAEADTDGDGSLSLEERRRGMGITRR